MKDRKDRKDDTSCHSAIQNTGYWGAIEEIMDELFCSPKPEYFDDEAAAAIDNFNGYNGGSRNTSAGEAGGVNRNAHADHATFQSYPGFETSLASPVLAREIDALRYRYLNGKVAGQDLVDETGIIIIRANEPITPEVVNLADRKGKLAELIINMTIPELLNK